MTTSVVSRKRLPIQRWSRKRGFTELAGDPRKAHEAWKNLKLEEKTELVDKMIALYGAVFAHQFRDIAEHGKAQFTQYYWQPNTGPELPSSSGPGDGASWEWNELALAQPTSRFG